MQELTAEGQSGPRVAQPPLAGSQENNWPCSRYPFNHCNNRQSRAPVSSCMWMEVKDYLGYHLNSHLKPPKCLYAVARQLGTRDSKHKASQRWPVMWLGSMKHVENVNIPMKWVFKNLGKDSCD